MKEVERIIYSFALELKSLRVEIENLKKRDVENSNKKPESKKLGKVVNFNP